SSCSAKHRAISSHFSQPLTTAGRVVGSCPAVVRGSGKAYGDLSRTVRCCAKVLAWGQASPTGHLTLIPPHYSVLRAWEVVPRGTGRRPPCRRGCALQEPEGQCKRPRAPLGGKSTVPCRRGQRAQALAQQQPCLQQDTVHLVRAPTRAASPMLCQFS